MKHEKLLMDLGTKATFFGLGLLASKKLRPYAKYFIIGGVVASAVPGLLAATEQIKAKKAKSTVEEVVIEEAGEECCQEAPCCVGTAEAEAADAVQEPEPKCEEKTQQEEA